MSVRGSYKTGKQQKFIKRYYSVVMLLKELGDLFGFALSQQYGIDEDAMESVADGLADEHESDGRINAARECRNYPPTVRDVVAVAHPHGRVVDENPQVRRI